MFLLWLVVLIGVTCTALGDDANVTTRASSVPLLKTLDGNATHNGTMEHAGESGKSYPQEVGDDNTHESKEVERYQVAHVNWHHVEVPFSIALWLLLAGVAKIGEIIRFRCSEIDVLFLSAWFGRDV